MSSCRPACLDGYVCRHGHSFDVLLRAHLSFAEFNVPKFKQITGSLNNAFGIQREIPIVEQPMGTTIISMTFSLTGAVCHQ